MFEIFFCVLTFLVLFFFFFLIPPPMLPQSLIWCSWSFLKQFKDLPVVNRTCTTDCAFLMLWVISPAQWLSFLLWLIPSMWLHYFTAVVCFCLPPGFFSLCFSHHIFFSPADPLVSARPSLVPLYPSIWLVPSFSSLSSFPLRGLPLLPGVTTSAAF